MVLTPGGNGLQNYLNHLTKDLMILLMKFCKKSKKIMGSLSLATMVGVGKSWIANRMIEFSKEYPDIQCR